MQKRPRPDHFFPGISVHSMMSSAMSVPIPEWMPILYKKAAIPPDAGMKPLLDYWVVTIPRDAWMSHAHVVGDFACTPRGTAARKLFLFISSVLTNASRLGTAKFETLSCPLDEHAVFSCTGHQILDGNGFPKVAIFMERLQDGRAYRFFYVALDPNLHFVDAINAWIALWAKEEPAFYGKLEHEEEEEEEDVAAAVQQQQGRRRARQQGGKRPKKPRYENFKRRPLIPPSEYDDIKSIAIKNVGEFYKNIAHGILCDFFDVQDQPLLPNLETDDSRTITKDSYDVALNPSHYYHSLDFLFRKGAFAPHPDSDIPVPVGPAEERWNLADVEGRLNETYRILRFPVPENARYIPGNGMTPKKFMAMPFPADWERDVVMECIRNIIQDMPPQYSGVFSALAKSYADKQKDAVTETHEEYPSENEKILYISDALYSLEAINAPRYSMLRTFSTLMDNYERIGRQNQIGFTIPKHKIAEAWEEYREEALERFAAAMLYRNDVSPAIRFIWNEFQSLFSMENPMEVPEITQKEAKGMDRWGQHNIAFNWDLERSLDIVSAHQYIRMILWAAASVYNPADQLPCNVAMFSGPAKGKSFILQIAQELIPSNLVSVTVRGSPMVITAARNDCFGIQLVHELPGTNSLDMKRLSPAQIEAAQMEKTAMTEGHLRTASLNIVNDDAGNETRKESGIDRDYHKVTIGATNYREADSARNSRFLWLFPTTQDRPGRSAADRSLVRPSALLKGGKCMACTDHQRVWIIMAALQNLVFTKTLPEPTMDVGSIVMERVVSYLKKRGYLKSLDARGQQQIISCMESAVFWHVAYQALHWEKSPWAKKKDDGNVIIPPLTVMDFQELLPLMFVDESLAIDVVAGFCADRLDAIMHEMMVRAMESLANYKCGENEHFHCISEGRRNIPHRQVQQEIKFYSPNGQNQLDPNYLQFEGTIADLAAQICSKCSTMPDRHDSDQVKSWLNDLIATSATRNVLVLPIWTMKLEDTSNNEAEGLFNYVKSNAAQCVRQNLQVLKISTNSSKKPIVAILREFLYSSAMADMKNAVQSLCYAHTRERKVLIGMPTYAFNDQTTSAPFVTQAVEMTRKPENQRITRKNPRAVCSTTSDPLSDITATQVKEQIEGSYEDYFFHQHLRMCGLSYSPQYEPFLPSHDFADKGCDYPKSFLEKEKELNNQLREDEQAESQ